MNDDGEPFYTMRLVDGTPLSTLMDRAGNAKQRMRLLPTVLRVAQALARISHHLLLRRAIAAHLRGLLPAPSSTHRKCACGGLRCEVRESACSHPPRDELGEICGLAYAHERGVVHRDVKPDNVIALPDGDAVLLDWGIAKIRGLADTVPLLDGINTPVNSPRTSRCSWTTP